MPVPQLLLLAHAVLRRQGGSANLEAEVDGIWICLGEYGSAGNGFCLHLDVGCSARDAFLPGFADRERSAAFRLPFPLVIIFHREFGGIGAVVLHFDSLLAIAGVSAGFIPGGQRGPPHFIAVISCSGKPLRENRLARHGFGGYFDVGGLAGY